jgi:alkylhydroperoxidase family enzyme
MSTEKLLAVPAWYESELFDDAERAALALTDAATRLADRPGAVNDGIWAEAAKHFDEQLSALVLMVGISNIILRVPPGTAWN